MNPYQVESILSRDPNRRNLYKIVESRLCSGLCMILLIYLSHLFSCSIIVCHHPKSKPFFTFLMALYSPPKTIRSATDTFDLALRNLRSKLRVELVDGWNWHEKEDASRLIREESTTLQGSALHDIYTSDRLFTYLKNP